MATIQDEPDVAARSDEAALVDYLSCRDLACPLCRYNLRGLGSTRCPECGRELRLGVWLAEPRQAAWVATLVGLLLPAGFGILFVFVILSEGWPNVGRDQLLFNTVICYFLASPLLAAAMIQFRRQFLRLGNNAQWLLACGAILAFIVTFGATVVSSF